jgi:hypothetical protein
MTKYDYICRECGQMVMLEASGTVKCHKGDVVSYICHKCAAYNIPSINTVGNWNKAYSFKRETRFENRKGTSVQKGSVGNKGGFRSMLKDMRIEEEAEEVLDRALEAVEEI